MRSIRLLLLLACLTRSLYGFSPPRVIVRRTEKSFVKTQSEYLQTTSLNDRSTSLRMSFQLPPGGKQDELSAVITSALTLVGIFLFFASPLGGLVFALFNSLLVLSIAVPIAAVVAYQAWQYFNTIEGLCPNCRAPLRVMKSSSVQPSPSICLNCGSLVQASSDNSSIDIVQVGLRQEPDLDVSFFDSLFGGGTMRPPESPQEKGKRYHRENTIIDVEIDDSDNSFR